ncbi:PHP domain protein [Hydrogenobacter thermophilus TK-6]|uniref:DNA polymerase beta n=1 Tax=Hydrogenobacter thermophilus (strain DSM 6534 / IAM 12695 / TK-6) TaxID=608538 RepID=D3DIR6_HYDTT|nr:DNA polymerase/3'-5' exonuclease PolX [Hydrogenobacter thermophilus]ADO45645.1 PHP domain protein [Hydrogenobacter thermophilus TK-6]BAI69718.1 DNA polymerase beta family protein [Hydrogenobacter thermophilus TK-6]
MSKNKEIAEIFERMADILEFLGDNPYRISTYRRVANILSELNVDVEDLVKSGKIHHIPGIGASSVEKILEYLRTGKISKYEELKGKVPEDLLELMNVPSIGPKTLKLAYERLGIRTKDDFIRAVRSGMLATLPGFGEKKLQNIMRGIELWEKSKERMTLIEAFEIGQEYLSYMKRLGDIIERIELAGSLRRRKETVGDIDMLVSAMHENWSKIHEHFVSFPDVKDVLLKGETKSSVVLKNARQVDLRTVEPHQWGAALQYFTGSKEHNIRVRDIAKMKGLKVSEYGVFRADTDQWIGGKSEEEVYALIGMQTPPPEIRENAGEIELALEGKLPKLLSLEDVKGDFHIHTNWSDGIGSLEQMVETAYHMGHRYVVIGDHSLSSKVAKGLDMERYKQQWKEIDRLRKRYEPLGFYILKGCEVDILPDGSLDLPDEFLAEFDFVVASIHTRFSQDNTYRILKAIENPYVNLIGHPTGKSYGTREGYPLDMDRVIQLAKETGTALELNTFRADLSPENVRKCMQKGVFIAIVTDAHAPAHLRYIELGVGLARRGWAMPELVLNTKDVEGIREFVYKKRKLLAAT